MIQWTANLLTVRTERWNDAQADIRRESAAGLWVHQYTSQASGVGKGYVSPDDYERRVLLTKTNCPPNRQQSTLQSIPVEWPAK